MNPVALLTTTARPGTLHAALRERGPARHLVLETLSGWCPTAICRCSPISASERRIGYSGLGLPARLAAAGARTFSASAVSSVVAARQPVSGWQSSSFPRSPPRIPYPIALLLLDSDVVFCRDFDLSRYEYQLHPLLTMPNAVTRIIRAIRVARDQPSLLGCRTPAFRRRIHRTHHILGPADHPRSGLADSKTVTGLDWSMRCADPRIFRYLRTAMFVQNDPASAARPRRRPTTTLRQLWNGPTLCKAN